MTLRAVCGAALLLVACLARPGWGQSPAAALLQFPVTGFSIAPLESAAVPARRTALQMYLPVSRGFAPNVNVLIQRFAGTMEEYVELTHQGMQQIEATLELEETQATTGRWKWTFRLTGIELRSYARIEMTAGKVFVVTGTARVSQWSEVGEQLEACVDSFRADSGASEAAASRDAPTAPPATDAPSVDPGAPAATVVPAAQP